MVEEIYQDKEVLYDHYNSPKKLNLKGIKYFTEPVVAKEISSELSFIKNKEKSSNILKPNIKKSVKKILKISLKKQV